ncbi:NAD-dependent deacylase [Marinicella gelatinilytica]|uniref:NAD-dependent deacylase n=1 Tax=Marinicella gelatinilytica TaxID=2996017 RepID=UPI002260C4C4|nr:NAD-dependent deacylase [Marinicella gelatinilytica]MCX7543957.1 NAD-dependent deacylase [Marinicella gelatinilytica]
MGQYQHIVVLTGAGISADSGLATFRAADGLWEDHRIEEVATPEAFMKNPALVHRFYKLRRQAAAQAQPNRAHICLADVATQSDDFTLISQNVDDLHQRAGSEDVLSIHGQLNQYQCVQCHVVDQIGHDELNEHSVCPHCQSHGSLRPDIVWFGEMPLYLDDIMTRLMRCDLFVAIGTSGTVYPAAGFVEIAKRNKAHTVMLNLDGTDNALFDEVRTGRASQVVPAYFYDKLGFKPPDL